MASNTTASCVQEDPQADECCENIPPEVSGETGNSNLKVTAENETLHSSMQLFKENSPVCDTCDFSTPAPTCDNSEVEAKSGCQSVLTPILKSINIDNECSSSQLLKSSNSPHLSFYFSSLNFSRVNCQKSTSRSGRLFCDSDSPLYLIEDECLPEVSNLDSTYLQQTTNDSVFPENESSKIDSEMKQAQTNADPLEAFPPVNTVVSTDLGGKMACRSEDKNVPAATGICETEITLLDASNNSELSPVGQITSMDVTQDFSPVDHLKDNITLSELNRQMVSEPGSSITVPNEDLSNTSVHSVKCVTKTIRTSLDGSMTSILEKGDSLSETTGQKMEERHTLDKDEVGAHSANITQNISSSSDMSAQGAHLSTSGVKCNASSARATSEVHSDSAENSNFVKTECEEVQTSCETESTSVASQQSHTWTASKNGTVPFLQSSKTSAASDCNSTTSVSCSENRTFDLSGNSSKAESEAREQVKSTTTKTSEKESSQGKVQNATFDRNSLQKTCDSSTSGEAAADDLHLQNTIDCKGPPQNNCTVTLSEISSSKIHCITLDEPFSPKISNLAACPEDEDHCSELPKPETAAAAPPNDDKAENHSTSDANAAPDSSPGVTGFKNLPQSGLPVSDGHFHALTNQNTVNNKGSTFDLDETLDLDANFLITSTPMTSSKTSNSGSDHTAGTNLAVQKKLYQDDPYKPTDKAASNIPSNIICDRKTFFTQPIPRALRPPSKATSQMLKVKPGSTVPEQLERGTTGLPVKRQKTQACGVNTVAVEPLGISGMSSTYNLRSLAAASKLPTSGLQRPQQSSISSGISKSAPGLRLLSTRSNRFASLSTNKPTEPTATNSVTKFPQGKKHPLSKEEALPISKKKKTDTVAPCSNTETTTSSCGTTNRVKTLKQPTASLKSAPTQTHSSGAAGPTDSSETSASRDISSRLRALKPPVASLRAPLAKPQGHGCSRCFVLQEELKQKADEIQRLKQELQKFHKQENS